MNKTDKPAQKSAWTESGKDTKFYEHYRTNPDSQSLRDWVDQAYFNNGLSIYLDKNFLQALRDENFYARLWELEVAEWLSLTGLKLIPTNGAGFDFCVELSNGSKIWIEVVYSYPDEELREIEKEALESNGAIRNTPRDQVALRYSSSLFHKANKIKQAYLEQVGGGDYVVIAISSFGPDAGMWKSRDIFELAVLPINNRLAYFGGSVDEDTLLPSHETRSKLKKASGVSVKQEFIYPGSEFPHIDAVLFSEASNLQQLLGVASTSFGLETNTPHIYQNYSGKTIPNEFTKYFYHHSWKDDPPLVSLDMTDPSVKLM